MVSGKKTEGEGEEEGNTEIPSDSSQYRFPELSVLYVQETHLGYCSPLIIITWAIMDSSQ